MKYEKTGPDETISIEYVELFSPVLHHLLQTQDLSILQLSGQDQSDREESSLRQFGHALKIDRSHRSQIPRSST